MPITPTKASWPWSLRKLSNPMPRSVNHDFHRIVHTTVIRAIPLPVHVPSPSRGDSPAINSKHRAWDERGIIRQQEDHGGGQTQGRRSSDPRAYCIGCASTAASPRRKNRLYRSGRACICAVWSHSRLRTRRNLSAPQAAGSPQDSLAINTAPVSPGTELAGPVMKTFSYAGRTAVVTPFILALPARFV